MTVLVCGSRDFEDRQRLFEVLDHFHAHGLLGPITAVMEGCAAGADRMAEEWARQRSVPILHRPADWGQHGRKAGAIRNHQMAAEHPDLAIAFYADRSKPSRGTEHMVRTARSRHILTVVA